MAKNFKSNNESNAPLEEIISCYWVYRLSHFFILNKEMSKDDNFT